MPDRISRAEHALRHGPTTGDRVRLGDTDLWIRIERDLTEPADQVLWGYAKNLRSRMSQHDRATSDSELDAVIGGAIVVDPSIGVVKADVGIKDGRVVGIGRAGNPDITDGVDLTIGPGTWPIPCHGLIVTPGAIDSHVHLLSPRLVPVALSAGVTTLITAGFEEPAWRMLRTFEAFEHMPVNVGLQASARTDVGGFAEGVIASGAIGLKVHEDWGASARIIDAALTTADAFDVAVCLHTDGLNESGELEETVAAIAGRTIHAYHVEGVGGGHIPDLIGIVREPNVICSSTTPGLPYGRATATEHADMILIVHEGNPGLAEDVAAARERIHPATMAAEGPLHDLGAISIINSDSQGMGRIGETVRRTWQLAHVMKRWRASEAGSGWPNEPVRRQRARPALPGQVHGGAGSGPRRGGGGRIARARPPRRPGPVGPGLVRREAGGGDEGRGRRLGTDRRGQRVGARSGADTVRSRLGRDRRRRRRAGDHVRLSRRDGRRDRSDARDPAPGRRGAGDAQPHPRRPAREHRRAAGRGLAVDGTVTLDGRILAAEPVAEVPLNRRYFLS